MPGRDGAPPRIDTTRPDSGERSSLLASLVAFLDEHRYCGELDGGADEDSVWMTCTCGAVISRSPEPARRQ